jgi:hypothetical protein
MAIYRVLVPAAAAEQAMFVREAFCWPALLFGPLWLLARGLWRALALWCVGAAIVAAAAQYDLVSAPAIAWLYILSAFWLGLEGAALIAAARQRAGLRLADIVVGADLTDAEHGFFSRWRGAAAVVPNPAATMRPPRPASPAGVIGMFPEAGG